MVYFSNLRKPVTKLKLPKTERTIIVRKFLYSKPTKGKTVKAVDCYIIKLLFFAKSLDPLRRENKTITAERNIKNMFLEQFL